MPESHAGERFGRLTTVRIYDRQFRHIRWLCLCDCGKEHVAQGIHLRSGQIRSCGCLIRDRAIERSTHGQTRGRKTSPEYRTWLGMKHRCSNRKCSEYHNYGGRGIKVCEEWLNDFQAFFSHAGFRPSPTHSIDRIDVNGDYKPGNIRWATPAQQVMNRRKRPLLRDVDDQPITIKAAAEYLAMTSGSFLWSLRQSGVSVGASRARV